MIENISRYVKLLRKYNKLETEYETTLIKKNKGFWIIKCILR